MFPVLELCGEKQTCINNILYSYNVENTNNHDTSYYKIEDNDYWKKYRTNVTYHLQNMIKLKPLDNFPKKTNYDIKIIVYVHKKMSLTVNNLLKYYSSDQIYIKKSNIELDNEYIHYINYCKIMYNINEITNELKKGIIVYLHEFIEDNLDNYINKLIQTKLCYFYIKPDVNNFNYIDFKDNYFVSTYNNINNYSNVIINYNLNKKDIVVGII
jgi:hypothetical protein